MKRTGKNTLGGHSHGAGPISGLFVWIRLGQVTTTDYTTRTSLSLAIPRCEHGIIRAQLRSIPEAIPLTASVVNSQLLGLCRMISQVY